MSGRFSETAQEFSQTVFDLDSRASHEPVGLGFQGLRTAAHPRGGCSLPGADGGPQMVVRRSGRGYLVVGRFGCSPCVDGVSWGRAVRWVGARATIESGHREWSGSSDSP